MRIPVVLILFLMCSTVSAQFTALKTITPAKQLRYATVDRPGDLYLLYEGGKLERYNSLGQKESEGVMPLDPTTFDPHDGSRLFAFSRHTGTYLFFSPAFNFGVPEKVDPAFAITAFMVCAAGDRDLVILDSADWSLKKVSLPGKRVLFESIIAGNGGQLASVTFMREYQNLVFMLEPSRGILIFNMLGKLVKTIDAPGIGYFNFLGEELYYLRGGELHFFDLFSGEKRSLKLPHPAQFALITDERLYLIDDKKAEVFSVNP